MKLKEKRPLSEMEVSRLMKEFMVEYTYNSNAIEGNTLTLRETDMVLREITIGQKPLKDHIEAVSHKSAFYYIVDLVKENANLTEYIIKQIHYLVLGNNNKEDREVYRSIPVKIMGAYHEPVQPYLVKPRMESLLLDYMSSKDHIVTKIAKFHIEFESIHPFYRWKWENRKITS